VSDGHLFAVAPDQSKTKLKLVATGAEKLSTVDFKMLEWPSSSQINLWTSTLLPKITPIPSSKAWRPRSEPSRKINGSSCLDSAFDGLVQAFHHVVELFINYEGSGAEAELYKERVSKTELNDLRRTRQHLDERI